MSRVLIVGDLLCDMLAKPEREVLLGTDTFTEIHTSPGGSAANTSAWLAASGVEAHFCGRVGDDAFGEFLSGALGKVGVVSHLARDATLPTGKVFVLVDGKGERTMITHRGASEALRPEDLPRDLFEPGTHLHLTGYLFSGGTRRETAFSALRLAREAGMSVSVDPSSVPLLEDIGVDGFLEWTAGVDIISPNLREGLLISGASEPEEAARLLTDRYRIVVLKLGPAGALCADGTGESLHLPATPARVVDTTGAGDALCAGFLAAWTSGKPTSEALRRGLETASCAVEQIGGWPAETGV